MIEIDHLNIHLPAGMERRAHRIARLVAAELAARPAAGDLQVASLRVEGVVASPRMSDQRDAARIAAAIRRSTPALGGEPC